MHGNDCKSSGVSSQFLLHRGCCMYRLAFLTPCGDRLSCALAPGRLNCRTRFFNVRRLLLVASTAAHAMKMRVRQKHACSMRIFGRIMVKVSSRSTSTSKCNQLKSISFVFPSEVEGSGRQMHFGEMCAIGVESSQSSRLSRVGIRLVGLGQTFPGFFYLTLRYRPPPWP